MNFLDFAENIIKDTKKPLTAFEIWEIGKSKGYDRNLSFTVKGKTPWNTILARIGRDIKDNPNTKFLKIGARPSRFFIKDLKEQTPINIDIEKMSFQEIKKQEKTFQERDLHKYLSYFVYNYNFIYTKTIFHEESKKKTYSQWIHPDVVGVYFPFQKLKPVVVDLLKGMSSVEIKLYSYEIKKELNFSNLRESYFQAVSNSSWANEGYLVTASLESDDELYQEIQRLTNSFGIGVIKLDIEDPDSTEVVFPAREKDFIDIETINKIVEINRGFEEFLIRVSKDFNSREVRKEKYDKIYEREELVNNKQKK
ncbi:MAG TPA: HTH domain-containing protein [Candidatus Hydrogenedens sp.]|nr:HTH domain-containing protein [Candidatus Hydrogenedens sp.]